MAASSLPSAAQFALAQRLCRRTAIIDRGQILAIGTLVELTQQAGTKAGLVVEGENLTSEHATALSERLGRLHWELHNGEVHFSLRDERVSISRIAAMADEMGVRLRAVRLDEPNLETVFLELTGRALRD